MNLDHELDYLLPAIKNLPGIDYQNDWKLINMQIGSEFTYIYKNVDVKLNNSSSMIGNDQCASCINALVPLLTPKAYGKHVTDAIERIRTTVPRVLINLSKYFKLQTG